MTSDAMRVVFDFVEGQELLDTEGRDVPEFEVVAQYPKRVLTDPTKTLQEMGIVGRAVLFVQEKVA